MKRFFWLFIVLPFYADAQLQVAKIFSDGMVLQRQRPIAIWGKAIPGTKVEILFAGSRKTGVVKRDSTWTILFAPQPANSKPQTLTIVSGSERRKYHDILIGDVWVCTGQSNMEWPMKSEAHFKQELPVSDQPTLRFFNPTYGGKDIFAAPYKDSVLQRLTPGNFYQGSWQRSDSNSFRNMSAIAYYFGKEIVGNTHIPIGLINLSIGGAPIETFIRREAMEHHQQFSGKVEGNWLRNNELPVWIRERGAQNVGSMNVANAAGGPNHPYKPGFAFESGIWPLLQLPVKGFLFYQGESNAQELQRVAEYGALMKLMVDDYRALWGAPDLPLYFVQLSSIDTVQYKGQLWPLFRDEQRKAMQMIPFSNMAVSSDAGAKNDVHPRNKKVIGERLARWALKEQYGKKLLPSGPLPITARFENGQVRISFQYTGEGLGTADGKALRGFSLDGISETEAHIQNKVVALPTKGRPTHIYYGWKPYTDANLVNADGLPASTFKIEVL